MKRVLLGILISAALSPAFAACNAPGLYCGGYPGAKYSGQQDMLADMMFNGGTSVTGTGEVAVKQGSPDITTPNFTGSPSPYFTLGGHVFGENFTSGPNYNAIIGPEAGHRTAVQIGDTGDERTYFKNDLGVRWTNSAGNVTFGNLDLNGNFSANNYFASVTSTVSAGGVTPLTVTSSRAQILTGTTNQTYTLPDARTLTANQGFQFNNNSTSGLLLINDNTGSYIYSVLPGGMTTVFVISTATQAGTWDEHSTIPNTATWGSTQLTLNNQSFTLQGDIMSPAWTTNGIKYKSGAAVYTDTTSSGTVAAAYTNLFSAGSTIAASSATTYTNYFGSYFKDPTAGTNVTMTNKWALGADSVQFGTSNKFAVSTTGHITAEGVTSTGAIGTGKFVFDTSPTFSGTVTFPNTATISSAGWADANSYTTVSTALFNFVPTWNFSSTSSGLAPVLIEPTLVPTGASAGNIEAALFQGQIGTSAVNITIFRSLFAQATITAGYSGTIGTAVGLQGTVNNSGTNAIGTTVGFLGTAIGNGNAITSGTVNNYNFQAAGQTVGAGGGGTLNNYGFAATLSTGTGAGTTNYGLFITGNGGTGSATNYAIFSNSTAPSSITGSIASGSYIQTGTTVVGSLPTCNSGTKGAQYFVTDELAAVAFNTIATGSGANNVPVFCDGTNWRIG